jgi:hypothetical protein
MTLFPIGTVIRLIRLARGGSRQALLCLVAFVAGIACIAVGAIFGTTIGLIVGAVLCAVGFAGSRPGISWL